MYRKNFIITFITAHLNTLIFSVQSILIIPYLLKQVDVVTYAAYISVTDIISFFVFFDFGISTSTLSKISFSFLKNNIVKSYQYFLVSSLFLIVITPVFFICALLIFNIYIANFSFPQHEILEFKTYFWLLVSATYLIFLLQPCAAFLNGIQNLKWSSLLSLFATFTGAVICILLVINGQGLFSVGISCLAKSFLTFLGLFYIIYHFTKINKDCLKNSSLRLSASVLLKELRSDMLSSFLLCISSNLIVKIEMILLAFLVSPKIIIFYSVNKKLLDAIKFILDSFILSLVGPYTNKFNSVGIDKIQPIVIKIIKLFSCICYVFLSFYLLLDELFILVWMKNSSYLLNFKLILLMAINIFICSVSLLLNRVVFLSGYCKKAGQNITLELFLRLILQAVFLINYSLIGMIIVSIVISLFILVSNIKFINKFIFNKIINKELVINIVCYICLLSINSFIFNCFNLKIQYKCFYLIIQIIVLVWHNNKSKLKELIFKNQNI